ncbi:MAG: hypothetical protein KAT61_08330 [Gammaproteobacteria bacterium]|nr:hypothetical protein [Gammaproteobacteria bacterium]
MKIRLISKCLPVVCLLTGSLYVNVVFADWYGEQSQQYYSKKFGNFPPLDIDQQLEESMKADNQSEQSPSQNSSDADSGNSYQAYSYPEQKTQQPSNLSYDRDRNVSPGSVNPQKKRRSSSKKKRGSGFGEPWNTRGSGFSTPWDNSGSSFSGPWNNKGSGVTAPWDDSGSGFSFPWNNKGSGFSTPWDSNGSGFSAPWNNRGSSSSPWGNGRQR